MTQRSKIEYTFSTWNPVTGCDPVSAGCAHCYAERMARRLHAMGVDKYRNGFNVTLHPDVLDAPLRWKKPRVVFVNSMGDLFHDKVPLEYILKVFDIMTRASQHTFQLLTKRSKRLKKLAGKLPWPDNVWMGVTVENRPYRYRIEDLAATGARIKFLSLEPLLGSLGTLDLSSIDWAIVGGESGPGARPMEKQWVLDIQRQCREQDVAFFFKQWGGVNKKKTGRLLDGRLFDEMPDLTSAPITALQTSLLE